MLHGLLHGAAMVWLQHCSEVTADPVTAAAAEPGSAAVATTESVKMGPMHAAQGTIKQVTRQTSTLRHEIKTENKLLKLKCWWQFDNFGIEKLDVLIAGFEHDY